MMVYTLHKLEKNDEILNLDDSQRLSPLDEQNDGAEHSDEDAKEDDILQAPAMQAAGRSDLPQAETPMQGRLRELVLADGSRESSSAEFFAEENPKDWREPSVKSGPARRGIGADKLLLAEERPHFHRPLIRAEPSAEADRMHVDRFLAGENSGIGIEEERDMGDKIPSAQFPGERRQSPAYEDQSPGSGFEDAAPQLHSASDGLEKEGESQKPSAIPPNAVFLLKLLFVLVLMLLSIEAVLYLI